MVKVIITPFFSDLQELNEVAHNCLFLLFSFILFFFLSLSLFFTKVSNYSETEVDKY